MRYATLPNAIKLVIAAAIINPLSRPLIPITMAVLGAGAATGRAGAAGATAVRAVGAAPTGAATEAGRAAGAAMAAGAAAVAVAALGAAVTPAVRGGPPLGRVGNLIVGEALGFGGKLMRTVSFFGCTFAASAGLGGTAPRGTSGLFSAIYVDGSKLKLPTAGVKPYSLPQKKPAEIPPACEKKCLANSARADRCSRDCPDILLPRPLRRHCAADDLPSVAQC